MCVCVCAGCLVGCVSICWLNVCVYIFVCVTMPIRVCMDLELQPWWAVALKESRAEWRGKVRGDETNMLTDRREDALISAS